MVSNHRALVLVILGLCTCASARPSVWGTAHLKVRGGEEAAATVVTTDDEEELSLDDKVRNAMKKLGLSPPPPAEEPSSEEQPEEESEAAASEEVDQPIADPVEEENPFDMASRIALDMGVNQDLALAALGATGEVEPGSERKLDEQAARALIQGELDIIAGIPDDSEDVQQLLSEGHEKFLARRALAFAEGDMENARAILVADQMDAEEERQAEEDAKKAADEADPEAAVRAQLREEAAAKKVAPMKSVTVDANFDPTVPGMGAASKKQPPKAMGPPPPAKKSDVVFEATTAQIQELVLESPVPVLLDCYAPWCGPCKTLTPILEEIAMKGGGAFRLVKVNTDNERPVSTALEVTALPTIYAVRDGKILNSFQGMPQGEEMMKNFLMGLLMPGATFSPPVSDEQKAKFAEMSSKLAKTAGAAGFSFSARENLQTRMATRLEDLVQAHNGNMADAEDSAMVLRSLLSSVIRDPYTMKFRRVNLLNKKVAAQVAAYPSCLAILKGVGFGMEASCTSMVAGKNKNVVNVAPLAVARDCIDKWLNTNRHKVAADMRKRKDEEARVKLAAEAELAGDDEEEEEEEEEDVDPDAVTLKVRVEGKKKINEVQMHADDSLSMVIEGISSAEEGEDFQITCVAKKLMVKSGDTKTLSQSLRSLGLTPTATLVVKIGNQEKTESTSNLKERVAAQKNVKKGSHSMHSIGVYAKNDNLKGELIDGGGGVMYEQDVTDDEDEGAENVEDEGENSEEDVEQEGGD
jgi:thioredoxin